MTLRQIALGFVLLFTATAFSQVREMSFYFESGSNKFTQESDSILKEFIEEQSKAYIQIIEVNGFVESTSAGGSKLSQSRIDTFLLATNSDPETITQRPLGSRKEKVYFEVTGWDRIDVYYYHHERVIVEPDTPPVDTIKEPDSSDSIIYQKDPEIVEEKVEFGVPVILPIKFEGGTNKVLPESMPYLNALADSLKANSFLYAHIRGHVCCGNNMRISKKRAKAVYNYLLSVGVEKHRLNYKGYSNTIPIVSPERNEEDRETNRRVDVIFTNGEPFNPEENK